MTSTELRVKCRRTVLAALRKLLGAAGNRLLSVACIRKVGGHSCAIRDVFDGRKEGGFQGIGVSVNAARLANNMSPFQIVFQQCLAQVRPLSCQL